MCTVQPTDFQAAVCCGEAGRRSQAFQSHIWTDKVNTPHISLTVRLVVSHPYHTAVLFQFRLLFAGYLLPWSYSVKSQSCLQMSGGQFTGLRQNWGVLYKFWSAKCCLEYRRKVEGGRWGCCLGLESSTGLPWGRAEHWHQFRDTALLLELAPFKVVSQPCAHRLAFPHFSPIRREVSLSLFMLNTTTLCCCIV